MTNTIGTLGALGIGGLCSALYFLTHYRQMFTAQMRLSSLSAQDVQRRGRENQCTIEWSIANQYLTQFQDRLGTAGFISRTERNIARLIRVGILTCSTLLAALLGATLSGLTGALIGGGCGLYFGALCWITFLRIKTQRHQRAIQFHLPLVLESLILLVESGLGILPAIAKLCSERSENDRAQSVTRVLELVYRLSSNGIPFQRALEMVANVTPERVLRHVLLHLDLSGSEGGELIPALRSMSDHASTEWKLSVEQRVKRLENAVVFPVFFSVIGLLLLTAAVPILPLVKFTQGFGATLPTEQFQVGSAP